LTNGPDVRPVGGVGGPAPVFVGEAFGVFGEEVGEAAEVGDYEIARCIERRRGRVGGADLEKSLALA
jgi:hypothetical protein